MHGGPSTCFRTRGQQVDRLWVIVASVHAYVHHTSSGTDMSYEIHSSGTEATKDSQPFLGAFTTRIEFRLQPSKECRAISGQNLNHGLLKGRYMRYHLCHHLRSGERLLRREPTDWKEVNINQATLTFKHCGVNSQPSCS